MRPGQKRFCFDAKSKAIFLDVYNNGEDGFFRELLSDKSCSKNYEKFAAWNRMTDICNERTGYNVTKKQLQDLMTRIQRSGMPDPLAGGQLVAAGSDNEDGEWTAAYHRNGSDPLHATSTASTTGYTSRTSAARSSRNNVGGYGGGGGGASRYSPAAEMYRAKRRSLIVVSRLKAQALKAETAYWIQKRLDEMAERKAKGLPVSELPKGLALDKDLLTGDVKNLIPSDSEEEEDEEEEQEEGDEGDAEEEEEEKSEHKSEAPSMYQ